MSVLKEGIDNFLAQRLERNKPRYLFGKKGEKIKPTETPNPETGLFPQEEELISELGELCSKYMDNSGIRLVACATAFALQAHWQQARQSGDPYSVHFLWGAIELAKLRLDPLTIAIAAVHDVVEDTNYSMGEVVDTVLGNEYGDLRGEFIVNLSALSKMKSGRFRKEYIEKQYELGIVRTVVENPRAAVIKIIADRLHNMRTLGYIPDPLKRRRTCLDTQSVHIPMARILGLWDKAAELGELSLLHLDKQRKELAIGIKEGLARLTEESGEQIVSEAKEMLGDGFKVEAEIPSVYDIFQEVDREKRVLQPDDFYFRLNIILSVDKEEKNPLEWARAAYNIFTHYYFSDDYETMEKVNLQEFRDYARNGLTDCLVFKVKRNKDGQTISVCVYPGNIFNLEKTPMSDLFYADMNDPKLPERRRKALDKWQELKRRFDFFVDELEQGEITPKQFLQLMRTRPTASLIRVLDVSKEGVEPWIIFEGATAADYIRETARDSWPRALEVRVNGQKVPWYYVIRPNDKIEVVFGNKEYWFPEWIHALTNPQASLRVKKHIIAMEAEGGEEGRKIRDDIITLGAEILEKRVLARDPKATRFRLSAGHALEIIRKYHPQYSENDFLYHVGLNEVNQEILEEIVCFLAKRNREVGVVETVFAYDRPGQLERVSEIISSLGASIRGTEISAGSRERPSVITIFTDPDDQEKVCRAVSEIVRDRKCLLDLGLVPEKVRFATVGELLGDSR